MRKIPSILLLFAGLSLASGAADDEAPSGFITVKTSSPENAQLKFYYRIPDSYSEKQQDPSRILVFFGGKNTEGKVEASGKFGWGEWADRNNIFIVAPGYKNDKYYEPEKWSGPALMEALGQLKKRYNVCTDKLLYFGTSSGAQCVVLFTIWKPEIVRAWVAHGNGVFAEPNPKMRGIPGMLSCGEGDPVRCILGRNFIAKCLKQNIYIVWRPYPHRIHHDIPLEGIFLSRAFLEYYHRRHCDELGKSRKSRPSTDAPCFVGDELENRIYPINSEPAKRIPEECRVILFNPEIAELWQYGAGK